MSDELRNEVRRVQDMIIVAAEKRGYDEYMRVSNNMPSDITLNSIRHVIYPDYLSELENVLLSLTVPNRR